MGVSARFRLGSRKGLTKMILTTEKDLVPNDRLFLGKYSNLKCSFLGKSFYGVPLPQGYSSAPYKVKLSAI